MNFDSVSTLMSHIDMFLYVANKMTFWKIFVIH